MGASMHAHIEYKTADGRWLHWGAPHVQRDYRLFALIAGIRNEDNGIRNEDNGIRPMIPPRGLPEDLSEITRIALDQDNGLYRTKGHTWFSADEFIELQKKWTAMNPGVNVLDTDFEERVFKTYGPGGSALASHQGFEDMRAVFWFDN